MGTPTTLEDMVAQVLEALKHTGYCPSTIRNFKKVYGRLLKLAAVLHTDTLTQALTDRFVADSVHTRTGQYCHSRQTLHRAALRKLTEYADTGCLGWPPRRERRVETPTTPGFQDVHRQFLTHLRAEQKADNTVDSYRNISCKFLVFLENSGQS